MPQVTATVSTPIKRSFRVAQIYGRFGLEDLPAAGHTFTVEIPDLSEDWRVAALVGGSGSGKTTIAREAFGDCLYGLTEANDWPADAAFVDGFPPKLDSGLIFQTLTAVGFGTAKDWVKPYRVLSNGQKFRADLARALLSDKKVVAIDEMTSLLDRRTAFACCTAAAKAIRSGAVGDKRLVAVSCHYDLIEPLECDWVLDMSGPALHRGRVRRPEIPLEIVPVTREAWSRFVRFHYLDGRLHSDCQCFCAVWDGEPVAFCAMLHTFGFKDYYRISRVVTLPDFQGMGLGTRLMSWCAAEFKRLGKRVSITATHPAVIRHCEKSPLWQLQSVKKNGNRRQGGIDAKSHPTGSVTSEGRPVAAFLYVGPARQPSPPDEANN